MSQWQNRFACIKALQWHVYLFLRQNLKHHWFTCTWGTNIWQNLVLTFLGGRQKIDTNINAALTGRPFTLKTASNLNKIFQLGIIHLREICQHKKWKFLANTKWSPYTDEPMNVYNSQNSLLIEPHWTTFPTIRRFHKFIFFNCTTNT